MAQMEAVKPDGETGSTASPPNTEEDPISSFYCNLTGVDDKAKKDWIARAHTSPCAAKIDEILKDENSDKIKNLKDQMFDRIYETMAEELEPEHMKMAVVVKNVKFRWILSCLLTVFTLGFFLVVKPKDDDAVVVLTGKDRVIMLKRARHDFFGSTGSALLMTFARYLLILLLVLMVPSLVWGVLANGNAASQKLSVKLLNYELELEKDVAKVLKEKAAFVVIAAVLFFCYLVFFLWTKIPYDYGTRFRRSHAASAMTCAQLSFQGSNARRQGNLRLYFGRYPMQDVLDHGMSMTSNPICGPIGLDSMSANGKYGQNNRKAFFTLIAAILTVTTLIDAGFTWWDRSTAALTVASTGTMCEEATAKGPSTCSQQRCVAWSYANEVDNNFCASVMWYQTDPVPAPAPPPNNGGLSDLPERRLSLEDLEGPGPTAEHLPDLHDLEGPGSEGGGGGGLEDLEGGTPPDAETHYGSPLEAKAICATYGNGQPPCCGGCRKGKVLHYLSNTFNIIKESAGILTDISAICISFAAAQHVLTEARVSDHIEVPFTKSRSATQPISMFDLTCPLALYMFNLVFTMAFPTRDNQSNGPSLRRQRKDMEIDQQTHGVKNYEIDEECATLDEFFRVRSLAAKGSSHYFPRVAVPKRALGILSGEEVYGAWLESPRITIVSLMPVLITSFLVFVLFAFWPADWGTVLLPGMEKNPLNQVLTALTLSVFALSLGTLLYYIFVIRSTKHAVVITSERVFYLRYRSQCMLFCWFGSGIRVDVFRHDHDVFYTDMNTMAPGLMQKLLKFEWLPGDTYMQCIWGVIHFKRRFGNAVDVFHCCSQLCKEPKYMSTEDLIAHGVDVEVCKNAVQSFMEQKHDVVWKLTRQPDDVARADPLLYMQEKEEPLFHWSTKEIGAISSPYHINNDIVITTGRVFLWQRAIYKPFDCKTCCCFGACWCTCLKKVFQANRLQTSMSYISLPLLLSFSTDLEVEPPLWIDPNATPVKVPCCEKLCRALTLCTTCDCQGAKAVLRDPDMFRGLPRRRGPRTQLWMMWKHRFGPMISCAIKPYAAPECDNKDLEAVGIYNNNHAEMMEALDKIMNVAQAKNDF